MRSHYVFTRKQLEASLAVDADSHHRSEVLPSVEVTNQLRDLFVRLDPNSTGLVARDQVLALLFQRCPEDVRLPWKRQSAVVPQHGTADTAEKGTSSVTTTSFVKSGVCMAWAAARSELLDFCGFVQLCVSCMDPTAATATPENAKEAALAAMESYPSARLPVTLSPFARLLHATRSVRVSMSDEECLQVYHAFRQLDEGGKGFLDVVDVARGLTVLTASALHTQQEESEDGRNRRGGCLFSVAQTAQPSNEYSEEAMELGRGLLRVTRAFLQKRKGEHAIFVEMAQKMILCAQVGLEEALHNSTDAHTQADSGSSCRESHSSEVHSHADACASPPSCGTHRTTSSSSSSPSTSRLSCDSANAGPSAAALQARFLRVEAMEAAQCAPLVVSFSAFLRSYQCGTGAFPPELLHFANVPTVFSSIPIEYSEASVDGTVAGQADNLNQGRSTVHEYQETGSDKENDAARMASPLTVAKLQATFPKRTTPLPEQVSFVERMRSRSTPAPTGSTGPLPPPCISDTAPRTGSAVTSRRSVSASGGGPPASSASPFELALLHHLLVLYTEQLCEVPVPTRHDPLEKNVPEQRCAGPLAPHTAELGAVPYTVTPSLRDASMQAAYAPSRTDSEHEDHDADNADAPHTSHGRSHHEGKDAASSRTDSTACDLDGASTSEEGEEEPDARSPPPNSMDTASPFQASAADATGCGAASMPLWRSPLSSATYRLRPRWPEAAACGVPLVTLQALEKHLLLDLDPFYSHLEEVRWVLVQRVCEVARCRATYMYKECEVVNVEDLVRCVTQEPESLGLTIDPLQTRLDACEDMVAQSLPRAALALAVDMMVELGLGRPRQVVAADPEETSMAALTAVATLQRHLPDALAGCLDTDGVACEGITRFFTSCAEPCVVLASSSPLSPAGDDSPCCYLSMESLFTRLLAGYYIAAPPPRSLLAPRHHSACHTRLDVFHSRRLSRQEVGALSAVLQSQVDAHKLLLPTTDISYAEQPILFRTLRNALVQQCVHLCATRPFVADACAARAITALTQVRVRQRERLAVAEAQGGARTHTVQGWEKVYLHHLIFNTSSPQSPEVSHAEDDAEPDVVTWEAWAAFAVRRTFCAVGPEGCRQLGIALCKLPLWSDSAPPSSTGKALVHEKLLHDTVSQVFARFHPSTSSLAADAVHHMVWDVVGACPAYQSTPPALTGVLDMTLVLQRFLESFPVLAFSTSRDAPTTAAGDDAVVDVVCEMTDVQSIYFALKRLVACSHSHSRSREPVLGATAQRKTPNGELASSNASAVLSGESPASSVLGRSPVAALRPLVHTGATAPRTVCAHAKPRTPPIPFRRLQDILQADGLLYILCALGSQGCLTGEVRHLSRVLKALSLTEDRIRVCLARLGPVPPMEATRAPHGKRPAPSQAAAGRQHAIHSGEDARSVERHLGSTLRCRAMALALPPSLQHAAVQLYTRSVSAQRGVDGAAAVLDRHRLGSFVFHTLGAGGLTRCATAEAEAELVDLMDRLFGVEDKTAETPGHSVADGVVSTDAATATAPHRERRSLESVSGTLSLEEFLTALYKERCRPLSKRVVEPAAAPQRRNAKRKVGVEHVDQATKAKAPATLTALDALCAPFSPLPIPMFIE